MVENPPFAVVVVFVWIFIHTHIVLKTNRDMVSKYIVPL